MRYPTNLQQATDYFLHFSPFVSRRDITYPKEQGGNHFTMFIKDSRVIRIPREQQDLGRYLNREVEILNYLQGRMSFDVPHVLDYDDERGILCLSKVYGETVSYEAVNNGYGKKQQKVIGETLGRFLAEMAMVKVPEMSRESWSYLDEEMPLLEQFKVAVDKVDLEKVSKDDVPKVDEAIKYIKSIVSEGLPRYLSHFDFNMEHILFEKNIPAGLIDFDSARTDILPRELLLYSNGRDGFSPEIVSSARRVFSNMTGVELDQNFWEHVKTVSFECLKQKRQPRVV